jgi:hypothetical protein
VELTVPAGERELSVRRTRDGVVLFRARELVEGGRPHLFAPLSDDYCFTIEQRVYGDDAGKPNETPLDGANPFWILPEGIAFFTPNPEPGAVPTSGGRLACLRQTRCKN